MGYFWIGFEKQALNRFSKELVKKPSLLTHPSLDKPFGNAMRSEAANRVNKGINVQNSKKVVSMSDPEIRQHRLNMYDGDIGHMQKEDASEISKRIFKRK